MRISLLSRLSLLALALAWLPTSPAGAQGNVGAFSGSVNVFKASTLGCLPNNAANSAACTAAINGALATSASVTNVMTGPAGSVNVLVCTNYVDIVVDIPVYVTGIVLAPVGCATIEGLGFATGLTLVGGTYQDLIRIGAYSLVHAYNTDGDSEGTNGLTAPARTATNIILKNLTLNAQRGNGGQILQVAPANQPYAGAAAHGIYSVILYAATNILVDHVQFLYPSNYNLALSNVSNVVVRDSTFLSDYNQQDGVHIDGPSDKISVVNCIFSTGDDAIAINAPEGNGGDISDVYVGNETVVNAWTAARIYTSGTNVPLVVAKVRRVVFDGVHGSTQQAAFNLGISFTTSATADQMQDVLITNSTLTAPGFANITTPTGSIAFINDVLRTPSSTTAAIQVNAFSVGSLLLRNFSILRNGDGNAAPPFVAITNHTGGSAMGSIVLENLHVDDEVGSSYTSLPYLIDVTTAPIASMRIGNLDLTHVTALFNPATGLGAVTTIGGAGVLGTGVQFPDSVMGNNAPYISNTAPNVGKPVVKIAGVVTSL